MCMRYFFVFLVDQCTVTARLLCREKTRQCCKSNFCFIAGSASGQDEVLSDTRAGKNRYI